MTHDYQPDDTQPTYIQLPPLSQPLVPDDTAALTDAERATLVETRDRSQYNRIWIGESLYTEDQRALLPSLVERGLLVCRARHYQVTLAGRRAVAGIARTESPFDDIAKWVLDGDEPQPGDNLPESTDAMPHDGVDPLGLFPEGLPDVPEWLNASPGWAAVAPVDSAPPLPAAAALLATLEAARSTINLQAHALDDAKTAINLQRELNTRKDAKIAEQERAEQRLRDALDEQRRENATLRSQLATRPADDLAGQLAALKRDVDALKAELTAPVPYELVDAAELKASKVETQFAVYHIYDEDDVVAAEVNCDTYRNDGWVAVSEQMNTYIDSFTDGISRDVQVYVIRFEREVVDAIAGDDTDAHAEATNGATPAHLIPVVDHALAAPGEVAVYANHATPSIESSAPVLEIQV